MKCIVTYLFFLFASLYANASDIKSNIKGVVVDENGNGIPFASVALLNTSDSLIITGTATLDDGSFELNAENGNYLMRITFLSYQEKWINNVSVNSKAVDLGKIILSPSTDVLDDVIVEAERSQMELKLDKRVFNVGKDLSNLGGSASNILDNIPSVTVDTDGNVSLRGSQNVRILINGQPSGLIGSDPASALKMLQGDMIDRVEIITNPSARYDAQGEVGIINIILKKEESKGFNGSITGTYGFPKNQGVAAALNYRGGKANVFMNYAVNDKQSPGRGTTYQSFSNADTSYVFTQDRLHSRGGFTQTFQLGTDLFLNPKNTLTVSGLLRPGHSNNDAELTYKDFNSFGEQTQQVIRTEDEYETTTDTELSLNYVKKFKGDDNTLTIASKYIKNIDEELSHFLETSDNPLTGDKVQKATNTENEENYLFQADYILPLGKDKKFEAGAKSTMRHIENGYQVTQQNNEGEYISLQGFDDIMEYFENIHAGYAIFSNKIKKYAYQIGLRGEYSDITTNLVKSQIKNPRQYFNLFPSAHLSKEISQDNTLQLSYSRRLNRPGMFELLPFFSYSDSRRFFSGNPNLNPEFTHSFEAGHLKYWKGGSVLSSVYYRLSNGVIERITDVNETGFTRMFPINLSRKDSYGLEFNASQDIASWWKINGSANFFRAIVNGNYNNTKFYAETFGWSGKINSKITVLKKVDSQISFDYRSPQTTTQGKQKAMYFLNLGASVDMFKGNGTLSFSAQDIFNTRKRRWETITPGYYSVSEFQWRTRQFILSFNYRINQKKKKDDKGFEGGGGEF